MNIFIYKMSEEVKQPVPIVAKSKSPSLIIIPSGLVYTTCGYGHIELPAKEAQPEQPLSEEEKAQLPDMCLVRLSNGATLSLHVHSARCVLYLLEKPYTDESHDSHKDPARNQEDVHAGGRDSGYD